jgi:uncharacterized membrane protein
MREKQRRGSDVPAGILIILLLLLALSAPVLADTPQDTTITYIISPHNDGTATWNVEYRILQPASGDLASFEENTNTSPILSSDNIRQLMERSASEASDSTGRVMEIRNFSRTSVFQSSPTGSYGVIRYTFVWTNFSMTGDGISIGDAFASGMYLPVGASLIVQVPPGYAITSAEPAAGIVNGNLVWYGPDPFDTGEPAVRLSPTGTPSGELPLVGIIVLLLAAGGTGIVVWIRRRRVPAETSADNMQPEAALPKPAGDPEPTGDELKITEERIISLLTESGGELYQSEIIERLALPKSTVSSALIGLHRSGLVQKVRKGRENLIRRIPDD